MTKLYFLRWLRIESSWWEFKIYIYLHRTISLSFLFRPVRWFGMWAVVKKRLIKLLWEHYIWYWGFINKAWSPFTLCFNFVTEWFPSSIMIPIILTPDFFIPSQNIQHLPAKWSYSVSFFLCFPKGSKSVFPSGCDGISLVVAALHAHAVTHTCWGCHQSLLPGDPWGGLELCSNREECAR